MEVLDICQKNWDNKIIMSWRIWWNHSCFPKIIHPFHNSFKKSPISNLGSMDIWTMTQMSLLVIRKCICFNFFVDEVGCLMMQYKVSLIDVLWSPKDGPTIWLWKEDGIERANQNYWWGFESCSILLDMGNDELSASEKERFISNGISKDIEF
jgi:hypothetical protein